MKKKSSPLRSKGVKWLVALIALGLAADKLQETPPATPPPKRKKRGTKIYVVR
jgi:hypothetical protein